MVPEINHLILPGTDIARLLSCSDDICRSRAEKNRNFITIP